MSDVSRVITVFGGSGFIGRHLVWRLARTGARIRIACRSPNRAAFLKTLGEVGQIVPFATDIADEASVARAVEGASTVVNLIGILFESTRWKFANVQAEAPGRIAAAARAAGATRLVHISAIGADAKSPSEYARTKAAGEMAVLDAFPTATILRPSIVFGPEDNFFNQFATIACLSPVLPLFGGGQTRFQPVFVGDVADAIMACLNTPATQGKTYELGGPKVYSFRDLMKLTLSTIQRCRLLMPVPWPVASALARVMELLPAPMLTRDQVTLLRQDNVVAKGALRLSDLGLTPTPAEIILPGYLTRFRRYGK
ncbi:NADH dehydrogenase (ubiquinone) 1 alpha subcomplex subunit 9 [uncultured Gammaproteobacteria bacterium]